MNPVLEQYKMFVLFLEKSLGAQYEIVLHWLEDDGSYIAAIANSHISGRTEQSPLTGFALELIQNEVYLEKDFVTNYQALTKTGSPIQGSTFFIKNQENILLGLLCINVDTSEFRNLSTKILQLANLQSNEPSPTKKGPYSIEQGLNHSESTEDLSGMIEEVVFSMIDPEKLRGPFTLHQEMKIKIVEELEKKGVFQLKGAVPRVAEALKVSEPSIYRYLKTINKREEQIEK
ncbi:PAS domain-containing protein (plasmid) [Jeotgalibaca sp. MA1X17-3]|uniref:helix-turn-helix transcriptional regulator n=1 Tax=Jeotgalibaca sp. MA1X17-3 TaxID=2908211 RepID=UPI001F2B8C14|nr:PAS domain-containing protein [Jeotgalibaca sp. MA1X17-3]UJF16806.1 PAS domain-containing protein [Jeotgalibaca sp. MA1X17-3]